jgi:hypothetical protein
MAGADRTLLYIPPVGMDAMNASDVIATKPLRRRTWEAPERSKYNTQSCVVDGSFRAAHLFDWLSRRG